MPKIVHHLFAPDDQHKGQIEERLLISAAYLAANKPIASIKIDEVINNAQTSKRAFNSLFRSVDGLFKTLGQKMTNEMLENAIAQLPENQDAAIRMATKTKCALLLASKMPFLCYLLLKAEWPTSGPGQLIYTDIEKDIAEGIQQGCFTDMPPTIGVNIVLGGLRGAVKDIIEKTQPEQYLTQVPTQILVSLGVNHQTAQLISQGPAVEPPPLPPESLASKVLSLKT